jgi:hypothetical protein
MPPRAPRPPSPTSLNAQYYSAYRGLVRALDGSFHHFLRYVDPVHEQKGYWRFHTAEDEHRAYAYGLSTPEMVLLAVNGGDGPFKDIFLRWVPGKLDKSNKPSVGSATAHLEAICGERRALGEAMSFRGSVPTYPCSTDPELLKIRLLRYGLQKGNAEIVGFVESHQQRTRLQEEAVRPTETRNGSGSNRPQSDNRDSSSVSQDNFRGISASPDTDAPIGPAVTKQPTVRGRSSQEPHLSKPRRRLASESSLRSTGSRTSRATSFRSLLNMDHASFQGTVRSFTGSPEQEHDFVEFSKINDLIPCIDCGEISRHNWNCSIGSMSSLSQFISTTCLSISRYQTTQEPHSFRLWAASRGCQALRSSPLDDSCGSSKGA